MIGTFLVSGVGKRNHLVELLARECERQDVALVGADASHLAPARAALRCFEQVPFAASEAFGTGFADVLGRNHATAYATIIDPEIPVLSRLAAEGQLGTATFCQSALQSALICQDKLEFHNVMTSRGVNSVPTYSSPLATYPFIRKDRAGSAASGFQVFADPADQIDRGSAPPAEDAGKWIYQPFCDGQHYCVDAYFSMDDRSLVDLCVKEVLLKRDGESLLLRSFPRQQRFVDLVTQVARAVPMQGIVNLDVYDMDGELAVMEVNARIGGNYPASHAFGVNLLQHLVAEGVHGERAKKAFVDYESGVLVSKFIGFSQPYV